MTAARKRQFTLACCKGETVQAVACVRIGPKNDAVRSFFAQEACMSLCLLNVDPASPQFKAGAHLCKEVTVFLYIICVLSAWSFGWLVRWVVGWLIG